MKKKQIMWEKYENVIESQVNSPALKIIANTMYDRERGRYSSLDDDNDDDDDEFDDDDDDYGDIRILRSNITLSLPDHINNEIAIVSNFDCWLGHANFQITEPIKEKLDVMEGVELLKVCGRYRFLIGVGRLFEFKDVRQAIELELTGEKNEENV